MPILSLIDSSSGRFVEYGTWHVVVCSAWGDEEKGATNTISAWRLPYASGFASVLRPLKTALDAGSGGHDVLFFCKYLNFQK